MKKLYAALLLSLLSLSGFSQSRTGKIGWKMLFDIHDAPSGPLRDAKINYFFFKRVANKPNLWQRDMSQVREGIGYEWTEEIKTNPQKPNGFIFITTDPYEFERLMQMLSCEEKKDDFGTVGDCQGFTMSGTKTLASGRTISTFVKGERTVEVLSNDRNGIEEWIFQIYSKPVPAKPAEQNAPIAQAPTRPAGTEPADQTPPEITILEPADAQMRSLTVISSGKTTVKIRVADPSGIQSVHFNGGIVKLLSDGTYKRTVTLDPDQDQKTITIDATDHKGNRAEVAFTISRKPVEAIPLADPAIADIANGRYYALIISVQNYSLGIQKLANPHKDADSLAKVLMSRYKFNLPDVFIMKDPTTIELGAKLEDLKETITDKDNLLIFFSGHGEWDDKIDRGYWLLKDADMRIKATWLSNLTVKDYIRSIKSRHTLLITDACFAGSIIKRGQKEYHAEKVIYKRPSRTAMTSGNLEKVPDKSVFIKYFLERLNENDQKYLTGRQLFDSFHAAVINNSGSSPQEPQHSPIDDTGHEGGDFVFSLK